MTEALGYSPGYQLKEIGADIPLMVERAQAELPRLRRQAVAAALHSGVWQTAYPSLRSFPFRLEYKGYSLEDGEPVDVFDQKTGAVNISSAQLAVSPLGEFFSPLRTRRQGGFTQLRGLTYYVSLDFSKTTPEKKLEVMANDVKEGLAFVDSVDRRQLSSTDYLLYLGILDHVKAHTLTAFHALTFYERTGVIPDGDNYMDVRTKAQKLMSTATRAYHQAILGHPFDPEFNSQDINNSVETTADYIAKCGHCVEHFTYREVTNPVVILLGAHEAARKKSCPDLVIGIPSGGTEVAVATHLMYEKLYPNRNAPDIGFVPLSFHYRGQGGIDLSQLTEMLRQSTVIAGRRVLIVDDNSNTGSTLQTMAKAAIGAGASDVAVHIAEIDPARIMVKYRKNSLPYGVLNMAHPDLQTAMGISWTSDEDGDDLRWKEMKRFVKRAHYQVEKKDSISQQD